VTELQRLEARHADALLRFERENWEYFARSIPDRGDAYFAEFADRHAALLAEQATGLCRFHVLVDDDGEVLGRFNLVDLVDGRAELGFRVAEAAAGKGVAKDGVRRVCRLARDEYGLRRLVASAARENAGSLAVLRATGFTPTGEVLLSGRPGIRHALELYGGPMTDNDTPWEPPFAGTEAEHLAGALDRQRYTFRWKADGLDAAGLRARVGASALTLGGLLKHLALMEDYSFSVKLSGAALDPSWDLDDDEFASALDDTPEELYALWDEAVARSRAKLDAALATAGPEQLIAMSTPDGEHASLRRLLCDLIEEYGRHTGHADLLRETVDGRTGEDPPPGWRS
jgi:RimJ/RimL family protein N-acetyltransferase